MRPILTCIALGALLATVSCLEREEEIVVEPDGSVNVTHTIRGQGADLDGGEECYPGGPGYAIERTVAKAGTDDEETTLVARARFASVRDLPDRYDLPGTPHPEASLLFPTELRVSEEADGRHFVLVRRYVPREWARIQFHHRRAFTDPVKEILERGPIEELDPDARRQVLEALARFERGKSEELLRDAVRAALPDEWSHPLAFHAARAELGRFFESHARPEQLEELLAMSPEEIERVGAELEAELDLSLAGAVAEACPRELTESRWALFLDGLAASRRAARVTEDLADERFVVRVKLPGRVIAHDADAIEDGFAVWRFDGEDLRDREQMIELHTVLER